MLQGKTWLIPLMVLVLLFAANAYRWNDDLASKTFSDGVITWSQDRWTGHYWVSIYTIDLRAGKTAAGKVPVNAKNADRIHRDTEVFSWYWRIATAAAVLWLVLAAVREVRVSRER